MEFLSFGKCLSIKSKNRLATFVLTFLLNDGLNQIIFLRLFFVVFFCLCLIFIDCWNDALVKSRNLNHWKRLQSIYLWLRNIKEKSKRVFIELGITEFYSPITESTLENALSFALQHTQLTENELRTIKHYRETWHNKNEFWEKKKHWSLIDVTNGKLQRRRNFWIGRNLFFISPVKIHWQKKYPI